MSVLRELRLLRNLSHAHVAGLRALVPTADGRGWGLDHWALGDLWAFTEVREWGRGVEKWLGGNY